MCFRYLATPLLYTIHELESLWSLHPVASYLYFTPPSISSSALFSLYSGAKGDLGIPSLSCPVTLTEFILCFSLWLTSFHMVYSSFIYAAANCVVQLHSIILYMYIYTHTIFTNNQKFLFVYFSLDPLDLIMTPYSSEL